jgi:sulfur carrier protein ThiS
VVAVSLKNERRPDAPRGRESLDLPDGFSLQDLLDRLAIPDRLAQMVLVNGVQSERDRAARAVQRLEEGDSVAIFPPVAGG